MFNRRLALKSEGTVLEKVFTTDTLIGNLWSDCGEPAGDKEVTITVDGCDVGDLQITADWGSGSTFDITCINGGRILGLGGDGGDGGADFGATGAVGSRGSGGGSALTVVGFAVNVDIDDGYLLGGGGGGGGGAYYDGGASGDPGCGGGGGAGFSATNGGAAGAPSGTPLGSVGLPGGPSGPGVGGIPLGNVQTTGGNGGNWGACGEPGHGSSQSLYGRTGGSAGRAYNTASGGSVTFNGVKSEATLRSESRIKGQTTDRAISLAEIIFSSGAAATPTSITVGFSFARNGQLTRTDDVNGNTASTTEWRSVAPGASDFGDEYEFCLIERSNSVDEFNAVNWNTTPTENSWVALSSAQVLNVNETFGITQARQLCAIRRNDVPGNPSSGDDKSNECLIYFYCDASAEST